MHVGLVLGDGSMLHIEQGIDSAIERSTWLGLISLATALGLGLGLGLLLEQEQQDAII